MKIRILIEFFALITVILLILAFMYEQLPRSVSRSHPHNFKKNIVKEAMWYEKLPDKKVRCKLCFRRCEISEGKRGVCGVRENRGGKLHTLVYGHPCAVHIDPIEKEPVYHFYPGTDILCIATAGCSFRCKFCQNWHISQALPEDVSKYSLTPEDVVELAKREKCVGISHTYTEPTVFYEYMLDIAKLAKEEGIKNIMHTCGAMNPEPLRELLKYMDAVTVDLKGFTKKFYRTAIPNGSLNNVLEVLKTVQEEGVWLEIVNLIIPTFNDNPDDIRKMCEWIYENLGDDVPLHFSRFFPAHRMKNLPPTPFETMELAHKIARESGLKYVTVGNVPGHKFNSTFCSKCGKVVIKRIHFAVLEHNIEDGRCKFCGEKINGIWE